MVARICGDLDLFLDVFYPGLYIHLEPLQEVMILDGLEYLEVWLNLGRFELGDCLHGVVYRAQEDGVQTSKHVREVVALEGQDEVG